MEKNYTIFFIDFIHSYLKSSLLFSTCCTRTKNQARETANVFFSHLPSCLSFCPSVPVRLSVRLCLSVYLSVRLCLSVYLYVSLSFRPSVCLQSILGRLCIFQYVCMFVRVFNAFLFKQNLTFCVNPCSCHAAE